MNRTTASISLTPKFFNNTLSVNMNVKGLYIRNEFPDEAAIGGAEVSTRLNRLKFRDKKSEMAISCGCNKIQEQL